MSLKLRRLRRALLASVPLLGFGLSGAAQAAGLAVEAGARRTDGGALSQLEGGARLEIEAVLRNAGAEPLRLTGAVLAVEGSARLTRAEGPGARSGTQGALSWGEKGARLAPGETMRLLFAVEAPAEAAPDSEASFSFSAQAEPESAAAGEAAAPLRAETSMTLRLAPVRLMLERALPPESSNPLAHGDSLRVILGAEFPAGRASNVVLSAEIPPSARAAEPPPLVSTIGESLRCSGGAPPEIRKAELVWRLGDCLLPPGASPAGRRVELSGRFQLRDADPFLTPEAVAEHRAGAFLGRLEAEGREMGEASVSARMGGPLVAGSLIDPPPPEARRFEAGEAFELRYELRNVGDAPAQELEIWARPDAALDCGATRAVFETAGGFAGSGPCGAVAGAPKGALEPGEALTALLRVQARAEASAGAPLRIGLDAASRDAHGKSPRMRVHMLELEPAPPEPPVLRVADPGGWSRADSGFFYARPGDGAMLEVEFTPPKGVGRASLLLRARLLEEEEDEAGEAAPLGPAPLRLGAPQVEFRSVFREEGGSAAPIPDEPFEEDGWSLLRLPLGVLRRPPDAEAPSVTLRAPVLLPPEAEALRAGRRLEIRASLLSGGPEAEAEEKRRVDSKAGLLVELQEPDLALTAATSDQDRVIRRGESAEFFGDLCNLGEAGARGVVLTTELGPGWEPEGPQGVLLRRSDSDWPILEDAPVLRAETPYDSALRRLTLLPGVDWAGDLGAAECLRLSFRLTAAEGDSAMDRAVSFRLDPYEAGGAAIGGRRLARDYDPPPPVRIALRKARLEVGPGAEVGAAKGAPLNLQGVVTAPVSGGPYAISWRLRSAAGLRWRLLDGEGRGPLPAEFTLQAGERRAFRLEAVTPTAAPEGWTETLALHALATDSSGAYPAAARWVVRLERDAEAAAILRPVKTMAADRDCDGDLADETPQDALFEGFKDLRPGECLIFRIRLRNEGDAPQENVVLRDSLQPGLRYLPGSATIGPTAEGFLLEAIEEPRGTGGAGSREIVWRFQGALPPGAEAEARYGAKAPGERAQNGR